MPMTPSDAIFHTDRFRKDVIAYMKRNTTSLIEVARLSDLTRSNIQRFIAGDVGVTIHSAVRLALYADLSLDGYVKTWDEQEAWRNRNIQRQGIGPRITQESSPRKNTGLEDRQTSRLMTRMIKCLTCGKTWDGDGEGCECVCRDGDVGYETWIDMDEWVDILMEQLTGNVAPGVPCGKCINAIYRTYHPAGRPCLSTDVPTKIQHDAQGRPLAPTVRWSR